MDSPSFGEDLLQLTPETSKKVPLQPPPPDDLIFLGDEITGVSDENWQEVHERSPLLLRTQEQSNHFDFSSLTNGRESPPPKLTHHRKSYKRENSPVVGKSFKRLHEENGDSVTTSLTTRPLRVSSPQITSYRGDSGSAESHLEAKPETLSIPDFGRSRSKSSPESMLSPVCAFGEMVGEEEVTSADPKPEYVPTGKPGLSPDVGSISSGQSTENLLEVYTPLEGDSPQSSPRRGFKKFRRNLKERFRKRAKDEQQKPRSKSEKDAIIKEVSLDVPKPRSTSELHYSQNKSSEEDSPKKTHKARRSYTILLKDITDKYATGRKPKSKETSSTTTTTTTGNTTSGPSSSGGTPKTDSKYQDVRSSVARMPPGRFKRSLYCGQLKYKLRVALQGIHTPLSTSPIYLQLCADEDSKCDSRYHLVTLLQEALQRSKWRHDDMEIALLTESLRMVEPLPNQL